MASIWSVSQRLLVKSFPEKIVPVKFPNLWGSSRLARSLWSSSVFTERIVYLKSQLRFVSQNFRPPPLDSDPIYRNLDLTCTNLRKPDQTDLIKIQLENHLKVFAFSSKWPYKFAISSDESCWNVQIWSIQFEVSNLKRSTWKTSVPDLSDNQSLCQIPDLVGAGRSCNYHSRQISLDFARPSPYCAVPAASSPGEAATVHIQLNFNWENSFFSRTTRHPN